MSGAASTEAVLKVALPVPLHRSFDYRLPDPPPRPGCRVLVPFGRRTLVGIVVGSGPGEASDEALKPVVEVLDDLPVLDAVRRPTRPMQRRPRSTTTGARRSKRKRGCARGIRGRS